MADVGRFSEELQLQICNVIRLLRMKHVRPSKELVTKYLLNRYKSYGEEELLACFDFMERSALIYSKNRVKGPSYFVDRNVSTNLLNRTNSKVYETVSSITDSNNFIEIDHWEKESTNDETVSVIIDDKTRNCMPENLDHEDTTRAGENCYKINGNTKKTNACHLNKCSTPIKPLSSAEDPTYWYIELINNQQSTIANLVEMLQEERDKNLKLTQIMGTKSGIEPQIKKNYNGAVITAVSHTQQEVTHENTKFSSLLSPSKSGISDTKLKPISQVQQQLKDTRAARHAEFLIHRSNPNNTLRTQEEVNKHEQKDETENNDQLGARDFNGHEWNKNEILLAGDSLISGIEQRRLSSRNRIKVRPFSGATVEDMKSYITPLLKKNPRIIMLEIATNNCSNDTPEAIIKKIRELIESISQTLPDTKTVLCEIPMRRDNVKAEDTRKKVNAMLPYLSKHVMANDNIKEIHLSKKRPTSQLERYIFICKKDI